jgi:predicted acylesterase/phospholipase RssA
LSLILSRKQAIALARLSVLLGTAFALAACNLVPMIPVFRHVNERISDGVTSIVAPNPDQRLTTVDRQVPRASERPGKDALQGNVFIGLGVSGGGARAANFGTAVMQNLEEIGLMQHVTVLSSVSGGGLPTAWYGLHGAELTRDNPPAWEAMRTAMAFDFRKEWQHTVLAPTNLAATFTSGLNRSDLMVEVFERRLFNKATFAQLGAVGPRAPVVLFNATDITREGVGFAFSEEEFSKRNSRLDTFPIARAVMASGAFPGAFSSITLRNHPPRRPDGTIADTVTYTHLMDGGPSDNYGVDKLLQTARSAWRASPDKSKFACLFIVVDSHITNHASERATDRDLRNDPLDFLIDPNVFDGIDTLLSLRRVDNLARLGLRLPGTDRTARRADPMNFHFAQAPGGTEKIVYKYDRVVQFKLPVRDMEPAATEPDCLAWHISLNEIRSIESGVASDATGLLAIDDPVLRYRAALWEIVTRMKTDYRLRGPSDCSTEQLQDALYRTAKVTVRDDAPALDKVCTWSREHLGPAQLPGCVAGTDLVPTTPLPFVISTNPDNPVSQVRCRPEPPDALTGG